MSSSRGAQIHVLKYIVSSQPSSGSMGQTPNDRDSLFPMFALVLILKTRNTDVVLGSSDDDSPAVGAVCAFSPIDYAIESP